MPYTFGDYHHATLLWACGAVSSSPRRKRQNFKRLPVGFPTFLEALKIVIDEHMHVMLQGVRSPVGLPIYWQCASDWAVVILVATPPTCTDECMHPSSSKHTLELLLLQNARRLATHARLNRNVALLNAPGESAFQVRHPTMQCLL
jgi:hypothetical protein